MRNLLSFLAVALLTLSHLSPFLEPALKESNRAESRSHSERLETRQLSKLKDFWGDDGPEPELFWDPLFVVAHPPLHDFALDYWKVLRERLASEQVESFPHLYISLSRMLVARAV